MTIEELHVSGNFEWFVYLAISLLGRKSHSPSLSLFISLSTAYPQNKLTENGENRGMDILRMH